MCNQVDQNGIMMFMTLRELHRLEAKKLTRERETPGRSSTQPGIFARIRAIASRRYKGTRLTVEPTSASGALDVLAIE